MNTCCWQAAFQTERHLNPALQDEKTACYEQLRLMQFIRIRFIFKFHNKLEQNMKRLTSSCCDFDWIFYNRNNHIYTLYTFKRLNLVIIFVLKTITDLKFPWFLKLRSNLSHHKTSYFEPNISRIITFVLLSRSFTRVTLRTIYICNPYNE